MTLSLVSIVSQGVTFRYPLAAVLESAAPIVGQIIVNVDTTFHDGTLDQVWGTLKHLGIPHEIIESPWDWSNRSGGSELAIQSNLVIDHAREPWVLYLQADEVLHEDDYDLIRWLMGVPEGYAGAEFVRLYFWRDLKTLRTDWTQPLVRMFRRGHGRAVGDAMNCEVDGLVWPHDDGTPRLFHYTRVGTPEQIGRRIRNLDTLFHAEEELDPLRPYDFELREVDGHLKGRDARLPRLDPQKVLAPYGGMHPKVMVNWLGHNER